MCTKFNFLSSRENHEKFPQIGGEMVKIRNFGENQNNFGENRHENECASNSEKEEKKMAILEIFGNYLS